MVPPLSRSRVWFGRLWLRLWWLNRRTACDLGPQERFQDCEHLRIVSEIENDDPAFAKEMRGGWKIDGLAVDRSTIFGDGGRYRDGGAGSDELEDEDVRTLDIEVQSGDGEKTKNFLEAQLDGDAVGEQDLGEVRQVEDLVAR